MPNVDNCTIILALDASSTNPTWSPLRSQPAITATCAPTASWLASAATSRESVSPPVSWSVGSTL